MELRDYLRGLRRHWIAIVLMTAVGMGAGYGWTLLQTPVYVASASGLVQSTGQGTDVGSMSLGDSVARSRVSSYLIIAGWTDVAEGVIDELELETTPEELINRVEVTNPSDTPILNATAEASTGADAKALAEAWLRSMATVIEGVESESSESGEAPVAVISRESASVPTQPAFPDVQTALIVGGVLGFGFGIAFAMIRTAADRRIRNAEDTEAKTGVAVVGTIPFVPSMDEKNRLVDASAANSTGRNGTFAVSEALRALRTNLQFMDVDHPPKTIVVTSPLPGDGKSTIACNLALTLAAAGTTVVLVDGDLRRSMVAKTMGLPGGAGLSDVLAGRAALSEVLQRTEKSNNLLVLTAGSVPPNPSEVLGSERMHTLLADLTKHATVIIDAPPLLPVTDGAVLTHQADGALIVVTLGKTTYDLLEKALDTLRKARGRALGIVLNKSPLRGADAATYSYEYRHDYTSKHAESKHPDTPTAEAPSDAPTSSRKAPASKATRTAGAPAAEESDEFVTEPPTDQRG
ncbi:chromosome partitioning protein [Agromyces luteolus]|uniref:Polysaccharide biosynthesis tyrosine autokinase n=1 Tax=Agromyces luteolus TaxID=88373 RepID=A0A7C9LS23_9MICO|nr:polysaccharide biosynthesis tyrosine autokinase [Agromyces luteolus]MUN06416.1 polysaccharide biosynthesis tyrosine autokinase [Agromyces luteolus]GLK26550.1 chromosome partitioning protein [Agromyces luteolus]